MNPEKALKEWDRFRQGDFWRLYEALLDKEKLNNIEHLGNASKAEMEEMKFLQGINEGFKRIKSFPDRIIKALEGEVITK